MQDLPRGHQSGYLPLHQNGQDKSLGMSWYVVRFKVKVRVRVRVRGRVRGLGLGLGLEEVRVRVRCFV